MKPSTMTPDEIAAIDDIDELRKVALALHKSREASIEAKNRYIRVADIKDDTLTRLMPMTATLIMALAERCGLAHRSEIQDIAAEIGERTWPQWHEQITAATALLALPDDAEPCLDPHAGDSEMVLASPLHEAILELRNAAPGTYLNEARVASISTLVEAVNTGLCDAIRNGFKAIDLPAPSATDPGVGKIADTSDLHMKLSNLIQDLDMGMSFLRKDLRACMYRSVLSRIDEILYRSQVAHAQDLAET